MDRVATILILSGIGTLFFLLQTTLLGFENGIISILAIIWATILAGQKRSKS